MAFNFGKTMLWPPRPASCSEPLPATSRRTRSHRLAAAARPRAPRHEGKACCKGQERVQGQGRLRGRGQVGLRRQERVQGPGRLQRSLPEVSSSVAHASAAPISASASGLRVPHYRTILAERPKLDFFEIISENFMVSGGKPLYHLERVLESYRVVQHGVSMSIGGPEAARAAST